MEDSGLVILWRVDLCMDSIQNYMGVTIQSFVVRVHDSSKAIFARAQSLKLTKIASTIITNCGPAD